MTNDEVNERLEHAAFGTTRRAALTTLLGGALLLGEAPEAEATKKAERRKKRKQREPWGYRSLEVKLDNLIGDPVRVQYGFYNNHGSPDLCCAVLGTTTIPAHGNFTFQAPQPRDFRVMINAWAWIGNKYWFTFLNPPARTPKIGVALDGMLDHEDVPYCCPRLPWGQTVEYQRDMPARRRFSWDIEGRAYFQATRLADTKTHIRFVLNLPWIIPRDESVTG